MRQVQAGETPKNNGERSTRQQQIRAEQRREWVKSILLNLILATTVCMARAAMDSLMEGYNNSPVHRRDEHPRGEYPF